MNIKKLQNPIYNKRFRTTLTELNFFFRVKLKEFREQQKEPNYEYIHDKYIKGFIQFIIDFDLFDFKVYDEKLLDLYNFSYYQNPIKFTKVLIQNFEFSKQFFVYIIQSIEINDIVFCHQGIQSINKVIKSLMIVHRAPINIKISKYNYRHRSVKGKVYWYRINGEIY
jgi:hypothetical protein